MRPLGYGRIKKEPSWADSRLTLAAAIVAVAVVAAVIAAVAAAIAHVFDWDVLCFGWRLRNCWHRHCWRLTTASEGLRIRALILVRRRCRRCCFLQCGGVARLPELLTMIPPPPLLKQLISQPQPRCQPRSPNEANIRSSQSERAIESRPQRGCATAQV